MSLNWKEIESTIPDMKGRIEGGAFQKVWSAADPTMADCLFFSGYSYARGSWSFGVVLRHDIAGIFALEKSQKIKATQNPQSFVMLIRKNLLNKPIKSIHQIEGERVVVFEFAGDLLMVLELIPRKSNLYLLDSHGGLDFQKTVIKAAFRKSMELEGKPYTPPAKGTFDVKKVRDFEEEDSDVYWNRCSMHFWKEIAGSAIEAERKQFLASVDSAIKKTKKSIVKLESELRKANESAAIKEQAEILFANLYEIGAKATPKDTKVMLPHFEDGRLVEVTVDRKYSFSDNANRLFDKYKKLLRTEREASERLANTSEHYSKLESLKDLVMNCTAVEELKALTPAFVELGLKKVEISSKGKRRKEQAKAKPYLELASSDGFVMLVGRSKEENRRVTFKSSVGSDTWLHAKGVPGAHCIIKNQRSKSIPLSTLLEASQLVAYYSKVKSGSKVEIDYTLKKHVRSQKGSVAEVTYNDYKTLYIEADHKTVRELLRKNNV